MTQELDDLAREWERAKEDERQAAERRRVLEDRLAELLEIREDFEGTHNARTEQGYEIKAVGRLNRKVDAERLQELAAQHGLSEHLSSLFRWKPEIAMTAWKAAAKAITDPLLGAITTTPGRPSFTISRKDR